MRVIRDPSEIGTSSPTRLFMTVGNFDGLHLGHQAVISELITAAEAGEGEAIAVTFEPHPVSVVAPERAPFLLSPGGERVALMEGAGLEAVLVIEFTDRVASMDARGFLAWIGLGPGSHLCLGYDFHMGRDRCGDVECLSRLGREMGFGLDVVPPVLHNESPISSSRIRRCLAEGSVGEAAVMLGRPYRLGGEVVRGDGAGRGLRSPTANLHTAERKLLPADGVYFVRARDGQNGPGVLYVGSRPTFGGHDRRAEVHLLDFEGELYGEAIELDLIERIRGDRDFGTSDRLASQIEKDISEARRLAELGEAGG